MPQRERGAANGGRGGGGTTAPMVRMKLNLLYLFNHCRFFAPQVQRSRKSENERLARLRIHSSVRSLTQCPFGMEKKCHTFPSFPLGVASLS